MSETGGRRGLGTDWEKLGLTGPPLKSFQLTSRAFSPVHGRTAPAPGRKAGLAHLGFRRGHQQMGDDLRLGSRAQDPRRALRAAQGRRAC